MTRLEALHVTSGPQTQRGAVTCLRGFRPWRLAARPCAAFRARSGGTRPGRAPDRAEPWALLKARDKGDRGRPRKHAPRSDQIWASDPPYLGIYVTQESL